MRYIFPILITWICFTNRCIGEPIHQRMTVQNGLLSNEVYAITTDYSGHIWIATARGIVRYDGKNSVHFTTANGLTDNVIIKFFLSPKGSLWALGADKTLYVLNQTGQFIPYKYAKELAQILNNTHYSEVCGIYFEREMPKYLSTNQQGILQVSEGKISPLWPQKSGVMLMASYHLMGYQHASKKPKATGLLMGSSKNLIKRPNCIKRKNGDILASIDQYLFIIRANKILYKVRFEGLILALTEDHKEHLWISFFNGGIKQFDSYRALLNQQAITTHFPNEVVTGICEDFEGGYWLSTYSNGVVYVPDFSVQEINLSAFPPYQTENIRAVTDNGKSLYVVTSTKKLLQLDVSGIKKQAQITSGSQTSVCNDISYNPYNHKLYLSFSHGIFTADTNLRLDTRVIQGSKGVCFSADQTHLYTFGGHTIYKIRAADNKVIEKVYVDEAITCVFEDEQKTVWVGTDKGLSVFNHNTVEPLLRNLIHTRISKIKALKTHHLIVSSIGQGLYIIQKDQRTTHVLTGKIPLQNMVNDMSVSNDTVWAATGNGIVGLTHSRDGQFMHVQLNDALKEVKTIRFGKHGGYYLADNKLILINSTSPSGNKVSPRLLLDSVSMHNQQLPTTRLHQLSYQENSLTFHFHAIAYLLAKNCLFRYQLSGADTTWQTITHPELTLEALAPGSYTLKLLALTPNAGGPSNTLMIHFTINPPYWLHWGVISGTLLLLCTCLYVVIRWLFNQRLQANIARERYLHMEQQALAAQINPHFIFNALNSIQHVVLQESGLKAVKYLGQFSTLMRLSITHSRQRWIVVEQELKLLRVYLELEQLRFKNRFTFEMTYLPSHQYPGACIPSLLIQPFVENAILHGVNHLSHNNGHINIQLFWLGNTLRCVVADNGIGRRQSAQLKSKYAGQNRSYGVKITCERLQILCKQQKQPYFYEVIDLHDGQQQQCGTKVIFNIPYKPEHETDSLDN